VKRDHLNGKKSAGIVSSVIAFLMLMSAGAWGGVAVPPDALVPLNQIAVPQPPNLFQYVKNKAAAIRLGKAFFWDMQAGSDGTTACGSCHFSAGSDNRLRNSVNPGTNAGDSTFQVRGPGEALLAGDFPFHERQAPADFKGSATLRDANDIVGSQGITLKQFVGINQGSAQENGFDLADPIFRKDGVNLRQVTGRNTPSVINAVFNFTNFWDGRASTFFNGSSPFGPLDQSAGAWYNLNGTLTKRPVSMAFASLASQATGPPLNDVEMSFRGRTFPELGRKMLSLTPLGRQTVHPDDSELGNLSNAWIRANGSIAGRKGLKTSYTQMIRDAFQDELWISNLQTPDGFSQMEANFPLFWGLAIQLYESTLVSDDTRFDRFLGGDTTALSSEEQDGFNLFFGAARCDACHGATELSNASVNAARFIFNADNQDHGLLELMPVASGRQIIYDTGFNNTAVRPSAEDICRDGFAPFVNPLTGSPFPLSFSSLAELQAQGVLPFSTPVLIPGLPANFPVANGGAFKVPGLRNVELTAPYMHNGSMMTLEEVVDFYARGGNFPTQNRNDLDINIVELPSLQGDAAAKAALVALMKSMTDERVRTGQAPFDRPEIFIPSGDDSGTFIRLAAKNLNGSEAPILPVVTLNPVTTPSATLSQLIGGSKEFGASVLVKVNNGAAVPADSPTETTWSSSVTGLVSGNNSITISATDLAGAVTTVTANIAVNVATYTLKAAAGANGNISQPGISSVAAGTSRTYNITPNAGFKVAALVVDGVTLPAASSYSFNNVTANHYINAYFTPLASYSIKAAAGANGSISPSGISAVAEGSSPSYSITPNPGFMVAALIVDGVTLPGATSHSFTNLTGNHYINAYFKPAGTLTVRAGAGANGSISQPGSTVVAPHATQSYSITPNAGYRVSSLIVDGVTLPGATSYSFTNVTASHYVNAYFAPVPTFSVKAAAGANGSISPSGISAVAAGSNQSYTITPAAGFRVSALVVDGVLLPGATSYSFTNVTGSHFINAYFAP